MIFCVYIISIQLYILVYVFLCLYNFCTSLYICICFLFLYSCGPVQTRRPLERSRVLEQTTNIRLLEPLPGLLSRLLRLLQNPPPRKPNLHNLFQPSIRPFSVFKGLQTLDSNISYMNLLRPSPAFGRQLSLSFSKGGSREGEG